MSDEIKIEKRSTWRYRASGTLYVVDVVGHNYVNIIREVDGCIVSRLDRGDFLKAFEFHAPPPAVPEHAAHPVDSGAGDEPASTPKHYDFAVEPRKAIEAWGLGFNLGNVVKYVARCERKGDAVGDLKKARDYLDYEIQRLEAAK